MKAALQSHLRKANLPVHFIMHSFWVGDSLSESLAGTTFGEIMKFGCRKTEAVTEHYAEPTMGAAARGKRRKLHSDYAAADKLPLSDSFTRQFAASSRR